MVMTNMMVNMMVKMMMMMTKVIMVVCIIIAKNLRATGQIPRAGSEQGPSNLCGDVVV